MKIGLVLEGGATRGMYTAGVLDRFLEENIGVDKIVGVSAGALFGVNFVSRQKGRAIRYNKRFNKDRNYMGLRPLLREGNIISTPYAYDKVPRILDPFDDETFIKSKIQFYAVVTDYATGRPDYLKVDSVFDDMDILRASGSMPLVSKPVKIGQRKYLDGGISDSIPFRWMEKQGVDKIIVILTRHKSYKKKALAPALKLFLKKDSPISQRLERRHIDYNQSRKDLQDWQKEGKAFVISPSEEIGIGRLERDPDKLQAVYELGLKDGKNSMDDLKAYLKK